MSAYQSSTNAHDPKAHGAHPVGHVAPLWILAAVWIALMILTYLTVAATRFDLGDTNLVIAMVIATVKASLVVLFFMHLFWDRPFNSIVFIVSLAFVGLFVVGAMIDTLEYRPQLIETYQPAIDAAATGGDTTVNPQAGALTGAGQADTGHEAVKSVQPTPVNPQ